MKKVLALLLALASPAFAQSVQQSGNITPGHIASWITTGVIGDGGSAGGGATLNGSFTLNNFVCANANGTAPSLIDCGLSATGTNNWVGAQNLNGGGTAPTRPANDSTTNIATTAFVQAAIESVVVSITTAPCTADPTGVTDSTAAINACEALRPVGSTMVWPPGTYKVTAPLLPSKSGKWSCPGAIINSNAGNIQIVTSNFTIDGGGNCTINYISGPHAGELDRVIRILAPGFTTNGPVMPDGDYATTGNISVGATSFVAARSQDAAQLVEGDWVAVYYRDPTNIIQSEIKQVVSVAGGTTINVAVPFAQAFSTTAGVSCSATCWPINWTKQISPFQNVTITGLTINALTNTGSQIGVDVQPTVINPTVSNNVFNIACGLAMFAYGGVNLQFVNNIVSEGCRHTEISQFQGGRIGGNFFLAPPGGSNAGPSVNTGSFGMLFDHNQLLGYIGNVVTFNDTSGNKADHNVYVCGGTNTWTAVTIDGGNSNTVDGDTYFNCAGGVNVAPDKIMPGGSLANGTLVADSNVVANITMRGGGVGSNGVSIADPSATNTLVGMVDVNGGSTTPIADNGTDTKFLYANAGIWNFSSHVSMPSATVTTGDMQILGNGLMSWPNWGAYIGANTANFVFHNEGAGATIFDSAGAAGQYLIRSGAGNTTVLDYASTNSGKWTFAGSPFMPGMISNGTNPTGNTGTCSTGVTVAGGATVGTWTSTAVCALAGTIILTGMPTAPTGYVCDMSDRTTAGVTIEETATSATSVTFTVRSLPTGSVATVANDILQYKCLAY